MVEPRDDFETTEDTFEDFDDADGTENLGIDTQQAIDTFDSAQGDVTEQLRSLVEWIVFQLVDEKDEVEITADKNGATVRVQVLLPEGDLGKVIGRGGRIAKSMRTILMIVGSREHLRVSLDIEGRS